MWLKEEGMQSVEKKQNIVNRLGKMQWVNFINFLK